MQRYGPMQGVSEVLGGAYTGACPGAWPAITGHLHLPLCRKPPGVWAWGGVLWQS